MKHKRLFSLLLTLCLILSILPAGVMAAGGNVIDSGSAGANVTWAMHDDGTLVFSGTGAMDDNKDYIVKPWNSRYADQIKNIVLEEGITYIGDYAFNKSAELKYLDSLTIPSTVTSIGESAFGGLNYLRKVHISDLAQWCGIAFESAGANPLDREADLYLNGTILEKMTIPETVEEISNYAFKGCTSLKVVEIPETVKVIASFAFNSCPNLGKIVFRGDAPVFGNAVFTLNTHYAYYPANNPTWTADVLQDYGGTVTWIPYNPDTEDVMSDKYPSATPIGTIRWNVDEATGVLTITGTGLMQDYSSMREAPWKEFSSVVTGIVIEEGIVTIGDMAFYEFSNVTSVSLPSTLTRIGAAAFDHCGLKEITLPENLSKIGSGAFNGCPYLDKIVFTGSAPEESFNCLWNANATVYYPGLQGGWTEEAMARFEGSEGGNIWVCSDHEHVFASEVIAPTCEGEGYTIHNCTLCDHYYTSDRIPAAHIYTNNQDTICDICSLVRHIEAEYPPNPPVVHMFRMYDPNSGEHFYTGSEVEKSDLLVAGWNYEGIGFSFPVVGAPVYRLYDPVYGEHLYTMDIDEVNYLIGEGWNNEGIAFNTAPETEVPQYRLHNPNEKRGAYHFTSSAEERDNLLAVGWEYQGIGWYSCWK